MPEAENRPAPVRLEDIAKRVGLHVSTVSLALREAGNIAPETCQRVQQVAREMGYVPSTMALGLPRRAARPRPTTGKLALLTHGHANQPTAREREGLRRRAYELNYSLAEYALPPESHFRRFFNVLRHQGVEGLFFSAFGPAVPKVHLAPFAAVEVGGARPDSRYHAVLGENFHSLRRLLRHVQQLGWTRVGAVLTETGEGEMAEAELRAVWQGWSVGSAEGAIGPCHGGSLRDISVFRQWMQQHRPGALILGHWGQVCALRDAGIPVGANVGLPYALLRDDGLPPFEGHIPSWQGIGVQVGIEAVNLLDGLLRHRRRGDTAMPMQVRLSRPLRTSPLATPIEESPAEDTTDLLEEEEVLDRALA